MESKNLRNKNEVPDTVLETDGTKKKGKMLHTVTPLSKYLAMVLFVVMPFVGGWIGYMYAPEKVVEVTRVVEVEKVVEQNDSSKEFSDLYSYTLPSGWSHAESGVVAPSSMEIEEPYVDELGYYHEPEVAVSLQHWQSRDLFDADKTFMTQRWPAEYAMLLSVVYPSEAGVPEAALSALDFRVFPATLFTTEDERFQGVARINNFTQDYAFLARYELLLIDTLSGDMIVLSVVLDGDEISHIRSSLATNGHSDQGEFQAAQQSFADLLDASNRDELSFGYLMNGLDSLANSLTRIE